MPMMGKIISANLNPSYPIWLDIDLPAVVLLPAGEDLRNSIDFLQQLLLREKAGGGWLV